MTARTGTDTTSHRATSAQEIVGTIYEAFARGDVPAILELLSPDVAWDIWPDNFGQRADLPHLRPRRGREEVGEFFAVVAEQTPYAFTVHDLVADRDTVVAVASVDFGLPNGGRYADEELHMWTVGEDGLVQSFRHYVDTAKHIAALGGEDTTATAAGS
jgi:ketosteroid isomerase-like protein